MERFGRAPALGQRETQLPASSTMTQRHNDNATVTTKAQWTVRDSRAFTFRRVDAEPLDELEYGATHRLPCQQSSIISSQPMTATASKGHGDVPPSYLGPSRPCFSPLNGVRSTEHAQTISDTVPVLGIYRTEYGVRGRAQLDHSSITSRCCLFSIRSSPPAILAACMRRMVH